MQRLLIRAHRDPRAPYNAKTVLNKNLIGNNAGNALFATSVFRLLDTPEHNLSADGGRLERPHNTDAMAANLNRDFDHLVLPFANAFRPGYTPILHRWADLIERLDIPVTITGIGGQFSPKLDDLAKYSDMDAAASRFVAAALDHNATIGVRGEATERYLKHLGFGSDVVDVIGCPSLFAFGPGLTVRSVGNIDHNRRVTLNLSSVVRNAPETNKSIRTLLANVIEEFPKLVYVPQDIRDLRLMLRGTKYSKIPDQALPMHREHPLYRRDQMRFFVDFADWTSFMQTSQFSFGNRIHGNIASVLGATPAVVLTYDSRTLELAEYHHLPNIPFSELNQHREHLTVDWLAEQADYAMFHKEQPAQFEHFAAFIRRNGLELASAEQLAKRPKPNAAFAGPVHTLDRKPVAARLDRIARRAGRRIVRRRNQAAPDVLQPSQLWHPDADTASN